MLTVCTYLQRNLRELAANSRFLAIRALWTLILAFHLTAIPALVGSIFDGGSFLFADLVRLAGLSASALFFVLKIFDVSWLRLKPGWRSAVTALLIIGLLHLGVFARSVELSTDMTTGSYCVVLCVVTIGHLRVRLPVGCWLRRLFRLAAHWQPKHRPTFRWRLSRSPRASIFSQLGLPSSLNPRSPPALA